MKGWRKVLLVGAVAVALLLALSGMALAAPPNDNFADAIVITGGSGTIGGTNVGATGPEMDEPNGGWSYPDVTVWYKWTAPWSGTLTLTLDSNTYGFDPVLDVWTGSSLGTLGMVAADDDSGPGYNSRLVFDVVAGTVYNIRADGFGPSEGTFTLAWQLTGQPAEPVHVDIGGEYGDKMMDTYLYQAQPDTFLGASTANFVGRTGAGEERTVLSIPLAKLSGVSVTGATLDLTKSNGTLIPLKAYRLLPTLGKPTWNVSAAGAPWGAAGANAAGVDYSDEASATSSTGDFDVTTLLQAAIADGEDTLDLVLVDPAPVARRYVGFYAADAVHPAYRPCLRVDGTKAP